jgi:hypothetical protein
MQQIVKELSETVSEKDKITIITKMVLNLMKIMADRIHTPLKVIAFMQMAFGGDTEDSVNSCKIYI